MNIFESRLPLITLVLLAWRNLWRHRRRTVITLTSIALGFAIAVVGVGLQDGGHNSMIRNAIRMGEGHLTVQPRGYLEAPANYIFIHDGHALAETLEAADIAGRIAPRIVLQVLASTANNSVGAVLEGIDVANDPRVDMLRPELIAGRWLEPGERRGLLIGAKMARKLKADVGSKIVIMAGKQGGEPEAQLGRVRGIFRSGIDELDGFVLLSGLDFARRFLLAENVDGSRAPVTRFAVFLDSADATNFWKARLRRIIDETDVVVLDWREMMPQLVQYIVIDDAFSYALYFLILLVIVFGIVNTVLMSVLERTREFGLLRALGLSRRYLLALVFCESLLLSMLAVATGWLIGGALHAYVAAHGIDVSSFVPEGTQIAGTVMDPVIRSELSGARVAQLTIVIFMTTLASGIYPAFKAARITPVAALRT